VYELLEELKSEKV